MATTAPTSHTGQTPEIPTASPAATSSTTNVQIISQGGALTVIKVAAGSANDPQPRISSESITFKNTGEQPLDISGYTVTYEEAGKQYTFSDSSKTKLGPGDTLELSTGRGGETIMPGENETWAGFSEPVLNNDRGTITVTTPDGQVILKVKY